MKKFVAVLIIVATVMYALPCLGASFKNRRISDQEFCDICAKGSVQEVINALKRGANVNARDNHSNTPLMLASLYEKAEIVNILIKAGADVNAKDKNGTTALMYAAHMGKANAVNTLIEASADDEIDDKGRTALIHAVTLDDDVGYYLGNAETVNALIDAGSYVKQKDKSGRMAVDYARHNEKLKGTDALKRLEELSK